MAGVGPLTDPDRIQDAFMAASSSRREFAAPSPESPRRGQPSDSNKSGYAKLEAIYGKLPLSFEANQGQAPGNTAFVGRANGSTLLLAPDESVLVLRKLRIPANFSSSQAVKDVSPLHGVAKESDRRTTANKKLEESQVAVLRTKLIGAKTLPKVTGENPLPGKSSYFLGNDPDRWRTNIPTYARVRYHSVYPGIDLVYYGNQRQLEHDFIVSPNADAKAITLRFSGAEKIEISSNGDLLLQTQLGEVRQSKPIAYQETERGRQQIAAGYMLKGDSKVAFELGEYDLTKPLIIDPVLWYSTFVGGSGDDFIADIAVDSLGRAFVTGWTSSPDLPLTATLGTGGSSAANYNAFVMKLNATSSSDQAPVMAYSILFGGNNGSEEGVALAVDSFGNAYVTGKTVSDDFPTTANGYNTTYGGGQDAFLIKFDFDGAAVLYSTYLGGTLAESGNAIAVDSNGIAYIAGETSSSNFPQKNGFQLFGGSTDAFVAKFNPALSGAFSRIYSVYLGGSGDDFGRGIAVDINGNVYVTGKTGSTNFPIKNQFQGDQRGDDGFVTKLTGANVPLIAYSTYLGGSAADSAQAVAVDKKGNVYVTGTTLSKDFPAKTSVSAHPFQSFFNGVSDAFVAKLNPTAVGSASLIYSTFLGGTDRDDGLKITVDADNNAYVTGETLSPNFPTLNPLPPIGNFDGSRLSASFDAFVAEVNPFGTALLFSTYLGGVGDEEGHGIALDGKNNIYVAGLTLAADFPVVNPLFYGDQILGNYHGGFEGFIAKIGPISSGAGVTGTWDSLEQICHGSGANTVCLLKGLFTVKNVGKATAPNFVVRFYLSDDDTVDETDLFLKQVAVGELPSQDSKLRQFDVQLPVGTSASGLVVIAVVDADNDVDEPNENNNIIVSDPIP